MVVIGSHGSQKKSWKPKTQSLKRNEKHIPFIKQRRLLTRRTRQYPFFSSRLAYCRLFGTWTYLATVIPTVCLPDSDHDSVLPRKIPFPLSINSSFVLSLTTVLSFEFGVHKQVPLYIQYFLSVSFLHLLCFSCCLLPASVFKLQLQTTMLRMIICFFTHRHPSSACL